jgi:hypothetical protein
MVVGLLMTTGFEYDYIKRQRGLAAAGAASFWEQAQANHFRKGFLIHAALAAKGNARRIKLRRARGCFFDCRPPLHKISVCSSWPKGRWFTGFSSAAGLPGGTFFVVCHKCRGFPIFVPKKKTFIIRGTCCPALRHRMARKGFLPFGCDQLSFATSVRVL